MEIIEEEKVEEGRARRGGGVRREKGEGGVRREKGDEGGVRRKRRQEGEEG